MQQSFKTTIPPYPTISKFIPNISPPLFIYLTGFQLAWQVNGSIAAYDDIVARNKVRHPCFVPAGKVEVMLDGE